MIEFTRIIFLLQEIDCIVNQMMNVAEHLGWDVSELKPVSGLKPFSAGTVFIRQ